MIDFLPIVKKIIDPLEPLDKETKNAWQKVPRDWKQILLGEKNANDPDTVALLEKLKDQNGILPSKTDLPSVIIPHVATIQELEAAKNMFIYNTPDSSKEFNNKSWL